MTHSELSIVKEARELLLDVRAYGENDKWRDRWDAWLESAESLLAQEEGKEKCEECNGAKGQWLESASNINATWCECKTCHGTGLKP